MNDSIDRQAAIDALKSCYCGGEDSCGEPWIYESHAIKAVEQLPPIQPVNNSENPNSSDVISRQAAIDICNSAIDLWHGQLGEGALVAVKEKIEGVPSAQPEIIRCRNCKFASGDSRICMKFGHSPIGELDFCAWAERRTDG